MSLVPRTRRTAGFGQVVGFLVAGLVLAACARQPAGSPDLAIAASGFPIGTYVKDFVEPLFGPARIAWTFEADGRWAEIPLEGAPVGASPVRGSYAVAGDVITITTDYPPGFGSSLHAWRVEGTELWTTFRSSDLPDDADWFALLDPAPWIPLR